MLRNTPAFILNPLQALGRYSQLLFHAFGAIPEFGTYRKNLWEQMVRIGCGVSTDSHDGRRVFRGRYYCPDLLPTGFPSYPQGNHWGHCGALDDP